MREILMLRHGATPGNNLRQYIGATDEPLSEAGRTGLAELHYPDAKKVYISPLLRCRQTAEILFPGAMLLPVEDLREMDFGHFEGRSYLDMSEDAEYQAWLDSNCEDPIPGGETKADFTERCCAAFEKILAENETDPLVFVVHGGTIMAVLSRFGLPARSYYDWSVGNGHGFRLTWESESRKLHVIEEV